VILRLFSAGRRRENNLEFLLIWSAAASYTNCIVLEDIQRKTKKRDIVHFDMRLLFQEVMTTHD
jgi:hypothetical protein